MEYTIGKAAEAVGLTTYTLRYYEKEGLLPEIKRDKQGIRIFNEKDLSWIGLIRCLRNTGMSISDIKYILDLIREGEHTLPERIEILKSHKKKVQMQMEELQAHIDKIDKTLDWYSDKNRNY
ncbi:MerR family transcriptional regulator [Dethiothermospora halolimnae]|uniref:MerR family transcriptional regulator n=1 Tax=Dethiothermospora halolimnae TaxID=3114390 RepID=UPI003CCC44D5